MPSWVADHPTWEKAKEAALKTYKESDENFYAIVTSIYEKMGGKVKHKEKASEVDEAVEIVMAEGSSEGAEKGWRIRRTKHFATWKTNAEAMGLTVREATHPTTGEVGKFHTAKDKEGNHFGHFDHIRNGGEGFLKAKENDMNEPKEIILCKDSGVVLAAAKKWEFDQPVTFQWMPGGVTTINAHYNGKPIELTVQADEMTAKAVQASYEDWFKVRPKQMPFGCVEHREEEAAIRLPKDVAAFSWHDGTVEGEDAGIYCTALPTELGARNVNGRIHSSWSPSFTTDAEYSKAKEVNGRMVFPSGARGSRENPAKVTGVAFSVGSLTNKPAFRNISPVRAKQADPGEEGKVDATWSDAAREAAIEARNHHRELSEHHGKIIRAHNASAYAWDATLAAHTEGTFEKHHHAVIAHTGALASHSELNGKVHVEHAEKHRQMVEHHLKQMGREVTAPIDKGFRASEPNDLDSIYAEISPSPEEMETIYAELAEPPDPMKDLYNEINGSVKASDSSEVVDATWSENARKAAAMARKRGWVSFHKGKGYETFVHHDFGHESRIDIDEKGGWAHTNPEGETIFGDTHHDLKEHLEKLHG